TKTTIIEQDKDLNCTFVANSYQFSDDQDAIGKTDYDAMDAETAKTVINIKNQILLSEIPQTHDICIKDWKGQKRQLRLHISPRYELNKLVGLRTIATERTEIHVAESHNTVLEEKVDEIETLLSAALKRSPITVFLQDTNLKYTHLFNAPSSYDNIEVIGHTDSELHSEASLKQLLPVKEQVLEDGVPKELEVTIDEENRLGYYKIHLEPRYASDDTISGLIGTAVDITDFRNESQYQEIILREITHRSKNILTLLLSIAKQTARRSDSLDDFLENFQHRVHGMSASFDMLRQRAEDGVLLCKMLEAQLHEDAGVPAGKYNLQGPDVTLGRRAVENLGLAIHELGINACKYGAWSSPNGYIDIFWDIQNTNEGEELHLSWLEREGPIVNPPSKEGFGSALLKLSVGHALRGTIETDFKSVGVQHKISIPFKFLT
ncbi:MAG: HWE histidine kinase domain-containing protein, partial [Pseudomonadota bacterium]